MEKNFDKSTDPMRSGEFPKRKRSRAVTLALMGTGASAGVIIGLWLWGSSSGVDGGMFRTVDQCAESGRYDRSTCADAFAEAERHHLEMAPRFASRADCEADFAPGECAPVPNSNAGSGPSYAPVLAGALLGSALGVAAVPAVQPVYRSCTANPDEPCSTSSSGRSGGGYYTCSGYYVGRSYGTARVAPAAFSTAGASTSTMSRGGFGARAASMSAAS
jgi:uncharacterized protein YgiB involved in biofilm formation